MVLNKGWKSHFSAYTLCHQKHSTSLPLVSFDMGMKHRFCLDYRSIHNMFHFFSLFVFDVFHANFAFLMKNHSQINSLFFNSQGLVLLQTFPDINLQLGQVTFTFTLTAESCDKQSWQYVFMDSYHL